MIGGTARGTVLDGGGAADSLLDGLVSWWELDEESGTRVDVHGSNNLTDNNTCGYITGVRGNAASMVYANSEYLNKTSPTGLEGGARDFTYAAWYRITTTAGSSGHCIGAVVNSPTEILTDWMMYYHLSAARFRFYVGGNPNWSFATDTNIGAPSIGTWYHIIGEYDSAADKVGITVNNGPIDQASHTSANSTTAGSPFQIGYWGGAFGYANGSVDIPAFWSRKLTAAEKTRLYNAGAGMAYPG